MRFLPSLSSQLFLHLVSFSLQCHVCVLLYCALTVLCQVALTIKQWMGSRKEPYRALRRLLQAARSLASKPNWKHTPHSRHQYDASYWQIWKDLWNDGTQQPQTTNRRRQGELVPSIRNWENLWLGTRRMHRQAIGRHSYLCSCRQALHPSLLLEVSTLPTWWPNTGQERVK